MHRTVGRAVGLGWVAFMMVLTPLGVVSASTGAESSPVLSTTEGQQPLAFGGVALAPGNSTTSGASTAAVNPDLPIWSPAPEAIVPDVVAQLVADVTGDGKDDTIGFRWGKLQVVPGGVSGPGLAQSYAPAETNYILPIDVGDVTGDGIADVVVGGIQDPYLSVFPGGVDGGLGARVDYSVPMSSGVTIADVNGDGLNDVAFWDYAEPRLQFLVQTNTGSLERVSYAGSPTVNGLDAFVAGDFDGDGAVDFVLWESSLSLPSVATPQLFRQVSPGVWQPTASVTWFENPDYVPWGAQVRDLDGDGADELLFASRDMYNIELAVLVLWQEPGSINTSDPQLIDCRGPAMSFRDADLDGRVDIACDAYAGVSVFRQIESRRFIQEFYLNNDDGYRTPVLGDFIGDTRVDLVVGFYNGPSDIRFYRGVDPADLASQSGVIFGSPTVEGQPANGLCVEAISARNGGVTGSEVTSGGEYSLVLPVDLYVLRSFDCRPEPRGPSGLSYRGNLWGGSNVVIYVVTSGSREQVNISTDYRADITGKIVDNVTGEQLEDILLWDGIKDDRIGGRYWVNDTVVTGVDGEFTISGSYSSLSRFIEDPRGVYPPHTLYVSEAVGDIGEWGLVDPVMRDVRKSQFLEDILWLREGGITKGCNPPTNDLFCTGDPVTRGQMAAFLTRFLGLTGSGEATFVDDDGSVFEDSIELLAAAGITKGCNPPVNDRFCPDAPVTRGQMAAFLARADRFP